MIKNLNILVIDNYDSFTYNLVQLVEKTSGCRVRVQYNDEIALDEIKNFDKIILSPGPGVPQEAGNLLAIIKEYASTKSILGVCLGQQAIAESFGGKLINLPEIFHGVATNLQVVHSERTIFRELPKFFPVGRYHSWAVSAEGFPEELLVTAIDEDGMIMAVQHKTYDVHGVQFHPESVLTPMGSKIIENFLK